MQTEILADAPRFAIQTVFLIVPIWILFKVQKLKANFFLLFLAAALASGLDLIPKYGHYVAAPVLLLCLFRFTRANIVGSALTTACSYGIMFALNLYCMGSILGALKNELPILARGEAAPAEPVAQQIAMDPTTNGYVATPAQSAQPVEQLPSKIAKDFALKGVSLNAKNSVAMFSVGESTYTIGVDELIPVDTSEGKMLVRCQGITEHSALLLVQGKQLQLFMR